MGNAGCVFIYIYILYTYIHIYMYIIINHGDPFTQALLGAREMKLRHVPAGNAGEAHYSGHHQLQFRRGLRERVL